MVQGACGGRPRSGRNPPQAWCNHSVHCLRVFYPSGATFRAGWGSQSGALWGGAPAQIRKHRAWRENGRKSQLYQPSTGGSRSGRRRMAAGVRRITVPLSGGTCAPDFLLNVSRNSPFHGHEIRDFRDFKPMSGGPGCEGVVVLATFGSARA